MTRSSGMATLGGLCPELAKLATQRTPKPTKVSETENSLPVGAPTAKVFTKDLPGLWLEEMLLNPGPAVVVESKLDAFRALDATPHGVERGEAVVMPAADNNMARDQQQPE